MIELQRFLRAAQRRLWLARTAASVDRGLRIGIGVGALALPWKVSGGALPPFALVAAVAFPCVANAIRAAQRRPTPEAAARWADERCGGQAAFTTGLEFLLESRRPGSPAALAALRARIGRVLPAAAAQLAAERLPGRRRIALLAGTCVLLCGLDLRIPTAKDGLRPVVAQAAGASAVADLGPAPAADLGRAAGRLRTALAEDLPRNAGAPRAAGDEPGLRARGDGKADGAAPEGPDARDRIRGPAPADGGGREAGASAAPPSGAAAAGAAARLQAAFRDLRSVRPADGSTRAGRETLELDGRARSEETADFDAEQRAAAPYARRAEPPREPEPGAMQSAATRALLQRYAALSAGLR